jgi:glycosyltransferase involved in cell wall biosynthesis
MVSQAAGRLSIPRICHHRWIFGRAAIQWLNKYGAERHLFVSSALRQCLIAESAELAARPCEVVYDGLPLPRLPSASQRQHARVMLDLPLDKVIVLFAGQIVVRKGVADLLHAWQLLDADAQNRAELVIVGDDLENNGTYRREMQALADGMNCGARFVGFQKDVAPWLTAADIAVVPSHAEPLGNATLEAMSYGRPVIGSDVGGIPEMVVDKETGFLVPPKSPPSLARAIGALIADPALCESMGRMGRQRCEKHFSLEAHVNCVIEQYQQVFIERSSKCPPCR